MKDEEKREHYTVKTVYTDVIKPYLDAKESGQATKAPVRLD